MVVIRTYLQMAQAVIRSLVEQVADAVVAQPSRQVRSTLPQAADTKRERQVAQPERPELFQRQVRQAQAEMLSLVALAAVVVVERSPLIRLVAQVGKEAHTAVEAVAAASAPIQD